MKRVWQPPAEDRNEPPLKQIMMAVAKGKALPQLYKSQVCMRFSHELWVLGALPFRMHQSEIVVMDRECHTFWGRYLAFSRYHRLCLSQRAG